MVPPKANRVMTQAHRLENPSIDGSQPSASAREGSTCGRGRSRKVSARQIAPMKIELMWWVVKHRHAEAHPAIVHHTACFRRVDVSTSSTVRMVKKASGSANDS